MEIKRYFEVLWKWKSVFFFSFGTVVLAVGLFTILSTPVYETSVKLILLPSASVFTDYNDVRSAITALDNNSVVNTCAEIAQSSTIFDAAISEMNLKSPRDYQVRSDVESQTSVMTITVSGPDPEGVYALSNTITEYTIKYVAEYFEVYYLQELDKAELPKQPVQPTVMLNMVIAIILGLGTGVIFSYLGEYMKG